MTNSLENRSEILQDRFALKTASYLSLSATAIPYDISERLRAARVRAVIARKIETLQTAKSIINSGGAATLNWGRDERLSWWGRIGSVLPLVALVVGLLSINSIQNDNRAQEVAEVDAALLTDELPPAAFADPGFLQFLKSSTQVQ
jgi:hypothetical protein